MVGTSFVPPRANVLQALAETGRYPAPAHAEIHVGSDDWQSQPEEVRAFAARVGMAVTIVAGGGHQLGKAYVGPVLDRWLGL